MDDFDVHIFNLVNILKKPLKFIAFQISILLQYRIWLYLEIKIEIDGFKKIIIKSNKMESRMNKIIFPIVLILSMGGIKAVDMLVGNQSNITKELVYAQPKDVVQNITQVIAEHPSTEGRSSVRGQEASENSKPFSRVSNVSDVSRFIKIKVAPEVAANEIDFWARQMSEHALFAHLGLEDPSLKQAALETHQALEVFRSKFNQNPRDIDHMNTLLPLLKAEREFQIGCLKTIESGKWIGWIFPLFLNHITLELDYLVDKLNGIKYTPQEEVMFWNRINSEHAAFAAHLLDPSERELFLKADKMSVEFDRIPKSEKEMMIRLSLKASKELDAFNKTAQAAGKAVKSIIHPVLLAHVIREGERSIKTLTKLGLHKKAKQFAKQYEAQVIEYTD